MGRNPLARRIPGDERLNAVDCILPFFNRTTAVQVVRFLTGELDTMPGGEKKAVIDGKELLPNPNVPSEVWDLWATLPTQTLPQRGARPVKRLVALAQALSTDGVTPGALRKVEEELHRIIDAYATRYSDKLDTAIKEVWAVHVQEIAGRYFQTGLTYTEFIERADDRAIRTGFDAAKKAFGADIAQSYVNHLAGPDQENDDDGLREAYVRAAALATVKELRDKVDFEALELTERLSHSTASRSRPCPTCASRNTRTSGRWRPNRRRVCSRATNPDRGILRRRRRPNRGCAASATSPDVR